MKSIQKLRIANILISTSTVLILAITGCSKKDHVTPSVDMNKSKPLRMQVSAVAEKPNSITVKVSGFDHREHLNARFQYSLVKKSSSGNIIDWIDWKEDWTESTYESSGQTFNRQSVYFQGGTNTFRAPFIDGEYYIFRITYKRPGGGDIWFYTAPTEHIIGRTKQVKPKTETPNANFTKSMTITPDYTAASSYRSYNRGVIVLNFTELVNIDLNNIKRAAIKTRLASTGDEDYYKIENGSYINIMCDHNNDSFIIKGLGSGISYDIKIIIDGVERIVKNVTTTGTKVSPISLNNAHR